MSSIASSSAATSSTSIASSSTSKDTSEIEESEEEEVYEVEKLMGHRKSLKYKNTVEYLIKWKDYDAVYNSWENENNIFSKGLVLEYWNSQPYTLQAFRSGTHESAKTLVEGLQTPRKEGSPSVSSQKRRPTPSTVMLEIEKKQKIEDIRQAQITAEPPKGLTWKDIASVHNVFHCGKSTFFAEVRWIKLDTVSYVPTRIIRKNNPLKLIYFYESYLDFYVSPSGHAAES